MDAAGELVCDAGDPELAEAAALVVAGLDVLAGAGPALWTSR